MTDNLKINKSYNKKTNILLNYFFLKINIGFKFISTYPILSG